ncbi:hypothetical protein D3C71_1110240 [compost metagenome]
MLLATLAPVVGNTCIRPMALAGERAFGLKMLSARISAAIQAGSSALREASRRMVSSWCNGKRSVYRRCSCAPLSANTARSNQPSLLATSTARRRWVSSKRVSASAHSRAAQVGRSILFNSNARTSAGSRATAACACALSFGFHGHRA